MSAGTPDGQAGADGPGRPPEPPSASVLRTALAALPAVFEHQLALYAAFAGPEAEPPRQEGAGGDRIKAYGSHQSAAKAAVAHLEALLKLLRWAEGAVAAAGTPDAPVGQGGDGPETRRLKTLLREARVALAHPEESA